MRWHRESATALDRQAIRVYATAGRPDAVGHLLAELTHRLADLDPDPDIRRLATDPAPTPPA